MYAIVYKSDGFPICRQLAGVSPDPVVTWNTEAEAKAFIASKGGDADFQPVQPIFRRAGTSLRHRRQGFQPLAQAIHELPGRTGVIERNEPE